jgi:hypothetical protein
MEVKGDGNICCCTKETGELFRSKRKARLEIGLCEQDVGDYFRSWLALSVSKALLSLVYNILYVTICFFNSVKAKSITRFEDGQDRDGVQKYRYIQAYVFFLKENEIRRQLITKIVNMSEREVARNPYYIFYYGY